MIALTKVLLEIPIPVTPVDQRFATMGLRVPNRAYSAVPRQVTTQAVQQTATPNISRVARVAKQTAPSVIPTALPTPAGIPRQIAQPVTTTPVVNVPRPAPVTTPMVTQYVQPAVAPPVVAPPPVNPVIQNLGQKVKAGVGTEEGFQNAQKFQTAKAAIAAQPAVSAVKEAGKEAAEIGKKATKEISGSEAAGIALKKGSEATGEAIGSAGKKAMEFAADHPGAAGLLGGAVTALGLRRLLRRKEA